MKAGLIFCLMTAACTQVWATTPSAETVHNFTSDGATATVQFVNRKQVVVSVEHSFRKGVLCTARIQTMNSTSKAEFLTDVDVYVRAGDVNASLASVQGIEAFGAVITSLKCYVPLPQHIGF